MGKLIYFAITSLDGFVEDRDGAFDWGAPDEEVMTFVNDLEREVSLYLYGRRMYETMVYWETQDDAEQSPDEQDFTRLWQAADKVVYSRTLATVSSRRTRIERAFDAEAVGRLAAAHDSDVTIAGANLAGQAIDAGLVDEYQLLVTPIALGGGKPSLQSTRRLTLELLDERRFHGGVVFLRYRIAR